MQEEITINKLKKLLHTVSLTAVRFIKLQHFGLSDFNQAYHKQHHDTSIYTHTGAASAAYMGMFNDAFDMPDDGWID